MVNFDNNMDSLADAASYIKLIHVMGGIYIWEYVTTIQFEWEIVTGQRKYRWTILLYSGCRLSTLLVIVLTFVFFDTTTPIDCKLWSIFVYVFAHLTFVLASALIVLRAVAIWKRNLVISAIAVAVWLISIAFYIRRIVMTMSIWSSGSSFCGTLYSGRNINPIVILVADSVLLVLMLSGLRRHGGLGVVGTWRLLYRQGLSWLVLIIVAEIPSVVFIILNLNGPFNVMFQTPEVIMLAIGASRIYRGLADYDTMSEFNRNEDKSRAIRGRHMSGPAVPATIQLQETVQSTQSLPGNSETSRTEVDTV